MRVLLWRLRKEGNEKIGGLKGMWGLWKVLWGLSLWRWNVRKWGGDMGGML